MTTLNKLDLKYGSSTCLIVLQSFLVFMLIYPQAALESPKSQLETLWQEYTAFEKTMSATVARRSIDDWTPKYMKARCVPARSSKECGENSDGKERMKR